MDIVVLVDNSLEMTEEGILGVQYHLLTLFGDGIPLGSYPNEPRTTRIGIVAYNTDSEVIADLNQIQSFKNLNDSLLNLKLSNSYDSYLSKGLKASEDLLYSEERRHYQKAIIIYSSVFNLELDPVGVANRLKADGVNIITVNFEEEEEEDKELNWDLSQVASPNFNFTAFHNENLIEDIRGALLQANCFCPNDWIQYRASYPNESSLQFGTCLNFLPLKASWTAARFACRHIHKNSYLASEFSKEKHDFIHSFVQDSEEPSDSYHIGLNLVKGVWRWDQPPGWNQPELQEWKGWNQGFPMPSSSKTAVMNEKNGWQNIAPMGTVAGYICETAACDSDNYCDEQDVN
uniref:C-type lectin domain-containing protein n=1 Tax=Caenorhabditis tropicalis TaxID=1561998 RepID=A0A1I7UTE1_9PELO